MPSSYAHYRFGQLVFPALPPEIRRTVQRFRQLYDVGLHGPDLFFYYQPLFSTKTGELGQTYHKCMGKDFFGDAIARMGDNPTEGMTAYLFGVLAHYALDGACHPMIREIAAEGKIGHTELEVEFDRYLLTQDGKEPPHTQNLGRHMKLTWGECVTVAGCYPPAGAYTIRWCIRMMALVNRVLAMKNRDLLQRVFALGGKEASQMVMYPRPNHKCSHLDEPLMERFNQALERYSVLAPQLAAAIYEHSPLGEDFEPTFG